MGLSTFDTCVKKYLFLSLFVCQRCPVLVFFLNVIYLKWCRLTALMPPKKFWHMCVNTFLACFCVSEILTRRNRPQKKNCQVALSPSHPLSLSTFSVSLHLRVACAVATFLRTPRTSLLLWCLFPCPSRQPSCNSLPLSRTHLSPLLQADVEMILQAHPTPWSCTAGYMWAITLGSCTAGFMGLIQLDSLLFFA